MCTIKFSLNNINFSLYNQTQLLKKGIKTRFCQPQGKFKHYKSVKTIKKLVLSGKNLFFQRFFCYCFKRKSHVHRVWFCSVKTPSFLKGWKCGKQLKKNNNNVILYNFVTTSDAFTIFFPELKEIISKSYLISGLLLEQPLARATDFFAIHCTDWKFGG